MPYNTHTLLNTTGDNEMAIFAYARVSTADQTTENQRLEIERAGYAVDYYFADEGISGASCAAQRPEFGRLLLQIRDGETLVVSKLDRLGRDAQDVGATVRALAARGIAVVVLQLGKLDLASAAGKLMLAMLAAVAEMERDILIERTKAGIERARAQGKAIGRPVAIAPAQRAEIAARLAGGATVSSLAREFGVSRATVQRAR